jgi:stringent starvation protein B
LTRPPQNVGNVEGLAGETQTAPALIAREQGGGVSLLLEAKFDFTRIVGGQDEKPENNSVMDYRITDGCNRNLAVLPVCWI